MIPAHLDAIIHDSIRINGDRVTIINESKVRQEVIEKLVYEAVFSDNSIRPLSRWLIWEIAQELGIRPSSIHPLYMARSRSIIPTDFSVPAMNFRGLAFDTARALFKTAVKTNAKAFICELARGEMGYTAQTPAEYTISMLAGAIREGYIGPVFIQGDHFQTKCSQKPGVPDEKEIESLIRLIREALSAGFYNIDIDTSTLVDLEKEDVNDQQLPNYHYTAELIKVIRSLEPVGITVSVGGEIGHIGGKNSTLEDFTTYMDGLIEKCPDLALISKISVATGTSHGGVVNPDGSLAKVTVDFDVLKTITKSARDNYKVAGAVQHGASTLPDSMLNLFPKTESIEVHLATGFQNNIFDHPAFPKELLTTMYAWLDQNKQSEREAGWTDEQFHNKLRKKCWGQFKKTTWDLPESIRLEIREMLANRFEIIFKELNVINTADLIEEHTPSSEIHKEVVDFALQNEIEEVIGLSD